MSTNNGNNNGNNGNKGNDKFLLLVITIPIVIIMLIAGGAAFWNGLVAIGKVLVPNFWCILGYVYAAILGFFIARQQYKK